MKKINKICKNLLLSALLLTTFQCSENDVVPERDIDETEAINSYFRAIPTWEIEEVTAADDVYKQDIEVKDDNTDEPYVCPVFDRNIVETITQFVSVGTNEGAIWPGAMIRGNSLETGNLKVIQANGKRSPITLTTSLPLDKISVIIDPNSVNAKQAVADFMIAAGKMPEGSQSAGTMNFRVEEAISFEQSMRQMGVSAGFTEPQYQAGLEGSLSIEKNRSSRKHTVVAKFVQEMFKVRIADDLIASPADFFTNDFTTTDLETMKKGGEIGDDNIPIYIESVTYGRIMLFSSTSTDVANAEELRLALEGSMADYAKLEGEYNEDYEKTMSSSSHKIFSAGGTDKAANDVIGNLDWSKFFVESPASTAVPISFTARTVDGKEIVGLVYNNTFEHRDQCSIIEVIEPPAPEIDFFEISVDWISTDNTGLCFGGSGVLGSCSPAAYVKLGKEAGFSKLTIANGYERTFNISPDEITDFTVRSTGYLKITGLAPNYTTKTETKRFDAVSLRDGNSTLVHTLSNFAGSVKLTYRINKVTHYK
jgi:hypothetical protein